MALTLPSLDSFRTLFDRGVDEVIDVRSPSEFAQDHVPGAVNLPVLDDAERARVGTVYVQQSRFLARRIGAALVARNVAAHLEGHLSRKGPGYRPLVYCWRGGQRSGAFASILGQIGWQVQVLEGGYRSYRRLVNEALYVTAFPAPLVVLDGNTGTAKTELLKMLETRGVQVIDLEGLAQHRGSIFGASDGPQPTQKAFESALAHEIVRVDPARPVVVEAESNRIGEILVPPSLWQAMQGAPRLRVSAPLPVRAAYLVRTYADLAADGFALHDRIGGLAPFHPRAVIEQWQELAAQRQFEVLAAELMLHHYDPRYERGRVGRDTGDETLFVSDGLDDGDLMQLAEDIVGSPALRHR